MRRFLLLLAGIVCLGAAADPSERLADAGQEARARAIFAQVRCLVCQNESIDDSAADLAGDLRRLVRDEIKSGRTDEEVRAYLVSRYGEFVLLKPAFSWGNAALWGAPLAVVCAGLALLIIRLRIPRIEPELSTEEARRLSNLSKESAQ